MPLRRTTREPCLSRWRDPHRLGPLSALLALAGSAAAVGGVQLVDRSLGGLPVFPRVIEITLDKLGIVKWLQLLPPSLLSWLHLPLEEASLLQALVQQTWLQTAILLVIAVPLVRKWVARAWAFHAFSRPDSLVLASPPEVTGLTPWVLPEDAQVRQAHERLLDWLTSLVASAPVWRWWRPWHQQRPAEPLSVMLLLGPNGVGKSQLAWEMTKSVGAAGSRAPGNRSWDAGEWRHDHLQARFGLDKQVPSLPTAGALADLRRWRPRRPTLLVLDEPGVGVAGLVLDTLQLIAEQFHYPVALLIVDQVTPAELSGRMARAVDPDPSGTRRFAADGSSVRLGQVQLTVNDVRQLGSSFQRKRDAAQAFLPNLYSEDDLKEFVEATHGQPLTVALGVHELAAHPRLSVARWRSGDLASAESTLDKLPPDALRHRLIKARAEDLIDTWTGGQAEVEAHARLLDAIAAASLVGGLALDGALRSQATLVDLDPRRLERLFPGALANGRLPGFGSPLVEDAALTVWLARSLAPEVRAQNIVALAWAESPSRAARAALRRPHLPPVLLEALFNRMDNEEMTVALLLEQLRATVHEPASLSRARVAIERLPDAALSVALTSAAALLFEPAEVAVAPLARLELMALLAQRRLQLVGDGASASAMQLGDILGFLGRAQAAAGAFASWLDDAAGTAAAAMQSVLELCLTRWPLQQWRMDQLEALQTGWIDPLLSEPLDAYAVKLLSLLTSTAFDTVGQEELAALRSYQALWRALQEVARRQVVPRGIELEQVEELAFEVGAGGCLYGSTSVGPALMRLRLAVATHFNQAVDPFIMEWPYAFSSTEVDTPEGGAAGKLADPLQRWLRQAEELLPQVGLVERKQMARWCAQALRGRLFALTKAPERAAAVLDAAQRQLLVGVSNSDRAALELEIGVLFAALGGICALSDSDAATLEATVAAVPAMLAVPLRGAIDDVWRAHHAADAWALALVIKSVQAQPSTDTDKFIALHEAALGSEDLTHWAGAAFACHAGVRTARLVALERLLKAANDSAANAEAHRALLASQIGNWLQPLHHRETTANKSILHCATLACLSECVALTNRHPQDLQARVTGVTIAQQVSQLASAPSLRYLALPAFWRARAWYYVIRGCTQRTFEGDEYHHRKVLRATDDDFDFAQDIFRRELTDALPAWLTSSLPGKIMRAWAASHLVTLAGLSKSIGEAIAVACDLFDDVFLPALRECPAAPGRQLMLLQTISNLLVAIQSREVGPSELALAHHLYASYIQPVLAGTAPPPVTSAEEALKARYLYLQIAFAFEPVTGNWFENALAQQQATCDRIAGWGHLYETGRALAGLAFAAESLMRKKWANLSRVDLLNETDLGRIDEFVEQHIHSLARQMPVGADIGIEIVLAQAWRHCAFFSHQLRRTDLTGLYTTHLMARLTDDRFPVPLHPTLAVELARVLDYHASTLCLSGEHAHGISIVQGDLQRLADQAPQVPEIQFAWAEALSMALKSCPDEELQLAQALLDNLARAVARVTKEDDPDGLWLTVISECERAVQARWPKSSAEWWRAAGLPVQLH